MEESASLKQEATPTLDALPCPTAPTQRECVPPSLSLADQQLDLQQTQQQGEPLPLPDFRFTSPSSPSVFSSLLRTFLQRFSEVFPLGDVQTHTDQGDASLEARSHSKRPKHLIEAVWLKDVLEKCSKEIEDSGSFSSLWQVVSEHEAAARRVPESLEHLKSLNVEMHSLRQQIQAEDLSHKETVLNWNKTLVQMKQGIKDLKAENKLKLKYRADMALAQAEYNRRSREERLSILRDEEDRLTNHVEVEKRVNTVCTEFLKKQNLQLMEEAISLQTGHDNDVAYMDVMLNKLKDQKIEKEKLQAELEPKYMAEMSVIIAEQAEVQRRKTMSIDELRTYERETRAAIKLQKVWRGHLARARHSQEVKKIAKKRKELKIKAKKDKEKAAKEEKKDGMKGGGAGKKKGKKK